jgi:hypothetical protein
MVTVITTSLTVEIHGPGAVGVDFCNDAVQIFGPELVIQGCENFP